MFIREAVVSGQFYPSNTAKLKALIQSFAHKKEDKLEAKVVISPHAGYIYSGNVAGLLYSSIVIPDTIVLLGPNHTGLGRRFAIMTEGGWETPLGKININNKLAKEISSRFEKIEDDIYAHIREHSIEVQLPFLQFFNPNIDIVPICIMDGTHTDLEKLGNAVADAVKSYKEKVLIVVSSDMSHYISHDEAKKRDAKAIEKIVSLDPEALLDVCRTYDITMCGVYPAAVGIYAAKSLGANGGRVLKYSTSGEVSGDYDYVVGYAGIAII